MRSYEPDQDRAKEDRVAGTALDQRGEREPLLPLDVAQLATHQQPVDRFYNWLSADPVTGDVNVSFYETRNDTTGARYMTDAYLAGCR